MVYKGTLDITTTVDKDVFALIVYSGDTKPEWPIKLYQLVKDEWVLRNEYQLDHFTESPVFWFHDPGSEQHAKLIGCITGFFELRIGVTQDSQWETRPYTEEVRRAIYFPNANGPFVTYTTPCTAANHNSDDVPEYVDWQWAFCVPWFGAKQNFYELHRKSNDSDWEIKLIEEMEPGSPASCINTEGIWVYYNERETANAWVFNKPHDGEKYSKRPFGQPGDFAGVYCLCAVSGWFDEPRLFGISDGYVKEYQYNKLRTHIVGTPITKTRNINLSLSATIQQDRRNGPETIRLVYFPDEQDIMGTYVWTEAEGWQPGPQIV